MLAIVVTEYLTGATYALVETILNEYYFNTHQNFEKRLLHLHGNIICWYAIECGTKQ